jgi:hypothetical protein
MAMLRYSTPNSNDISVKSMNNPPHHYVNFQSIRHRIYIKFWSRCISFGVPKNGVPEIDIILRVRVRVGGCIVRRRVIRGPRTFLEEECIRMTGGCDK